MIHVAGPQHQDASTRWPTGNANRTAYRKRQSDRPYLPRLCREFTSCKEMIQLTLISTIVTPVNYDRIITKFDRKERDVNPDIKTCAKKVKKKTM